MSDMIRKDVLNMIIGLLVLAIVILATISIVAVFAGIFVSVIAAIIMLSCIIIIVNLFGEQSLSEFQLYLTITIIGSMGLLISYVIFFSCLAKGPVNPIIVAICSPIALLLEWLLFIYYG
jgi:hypothetical protein